MASEEGHAKPMMSGGVMRPAVMARQCWKPMTCGTGRGSGGQTDRVACEGTEGTGGREEAQQGKRPL